LIIKEKTVKKMVTDNTASLKLLQRFRVIGIAEGVSFLVLLLIAMPVKYFLKIPEAVKVVGWMHGLLFITYFYFAIQVLVTFKKSAGWSVKTFLAAFIPLGTFVTDKELKKEIMAMQQS
jgi:integral membrane protein